MTNNEKEHGKYIKTNSFSFFLSNPFFASNLFNYKFWKQKVLEMIKVRENWPWSFFIELDMFKVIFYRYQISVIIQFIFSVINLQFICKKQ